MHRISVILKLLLVLSVLSSCIEPFSLNLESNVEAKYVVYGQVTDQEGYQTISISMASTMNEPAYSPLSNCDVTIIDSLGNVFQLNEFEKGTYKVWMEKKYLYPGNSFQVKIVTPSGIEIESEYDQMPDCPEIDSIYFIRKDIPTNNPAIMLQGIQFYIDVDGKNSDSRFFRWELVETWEHHAAYPKTFYWNCVSIIKIDPPDYSKFYCWTTKNLPNIYTLSTKDLIQNHYRMQEFHFVDNRTQRLTYCYSLLVKQYAISEPAFIFWEKLRVNSSEHGGLYDTQPLRIKGNLKNLTNPKQEVLGFFSANSLRSKRIFVRNVENLELLYPHCDPAPPDRSDFKKGRPQYLVPSVGGLYIIEDACVECDIYGIGSTIKPDFWPY